MLAIGYRDAIMLRLHPSARYCSVDRRVMGWGSSSTHRAKILAGSYKDTRGHFPEAQLAVAMRTPHASGPVALTARALQALGDHNEATGLFGSYFCLVSSTECPSRASCSQHVASMKRHRKGITDSS